MAAGVQSQTEAGHVDLILEQIDQLPTLSPIAVKVMAISESTTTDLIEVSRLIESDPALTTRILSLCRRANRITANAITTVDRAVVMLGLDAVRGAMLSVEIVELLTGDNRDTSQDELIFERRELWRHCLATACASELLAEARPDAVGGYNPSEAFLAGLLHDLGKLILDRILPRAFAKVAAICQNQQVNIAEVERRVLGIDHHVAGKRLAEHWGLPHAVQDVIWLGGQPAESLPDLPHRGLIGLVTIASALINNLHIGWSGEFGRQRDFTDVCEEYGWAGEMVLALEPELERRLASRVRDLGLEDEVGSDILLSAISRANERLGRMAALLEHRASQAARQADALQEITSFHARAPERRSMTAVLGDIVRSTQKVFGNGICAVIVQTRPNAPWSAVQIGSDNRPASRWLLDQPDTCENLSDLLDSDAGMGLDAAQVLSWLTREFPTPSRPGHHFRLLPLEKGGCGGVAAALVHEHEDLTASVGSDGVSALASTWGAAIVAAARHEGAKRLGERVVEINRQLTDAQAKLVEGESLARLGELAAGAAHEMNNPLTVISGKSQLLAHDLRQQSQREAAQAIVSASHHLTDLITSLHIFAQPPVPSRTEINILGLLKTASEEAKQRFDGAHGVRVIQEGQPPIGYVDEEQMRSAVTELILNALQSGPRRDVEVRAQIDPLDDRLIISVADDGSGMSEHAQRHAFDPFFSELPAGRRSGLGLTRARRFIDLQGGELRLESKPSRGTTATIVLRDWRKPASSASASEAA